MTRATATTAKPLSIAERRARVAEIAKTATGRAKRGIALIDFREPTTKERETADKLARARRHSKAA